MPEWVKRLNNDRTIIILGRGHSGTRAIAKLLRVNGVFMGEPYHYGYEEIDVSLIHICCEYIHHPDKKDYIIGEMRYFLQSLINSNGIFSGWKRPTSIFLFPLLCELFPQAKFIFWTRHINDNINKPQATTDDLSLLFKLHKTTRQESWNYMNSLVLYSQKPKNFLHMKFEDFLLNNNDSLNILSDFVGLKLKPILINKEKAYCNSNIYFDASNPETIKILKDLKYDP